MDRKINKACEGCGSPFLVLVHSEDTENVYKCEYCGRPLYQSKDGSLRNPEIKKCENCGQINGPGTRVCQRCGTQIRYECPNCGSLVDLTATYCPYCEIHIQSYLEERKQRQAEQKRAEGLRRIQKLESEIKSLENDIDRKDEGIRKARVKADAIRNSGGKLHYFGKAGLSEDEKSILSQVSGGIGCGTKAIALILAITAMNLSWQLFIGLAGTQYNSFEPYSFFQNESASTLYVIFCLSVFVALGVARLVYALIMMLARKKSVDHLASEQESWLRDLQSEKRDLQNKLERLKRELAEARSHAL